MRDTQSPEGPGSLQPDHLALVAKYAIFDTIQGEGIYAGVPSTFLRLYGCNLNCSWCDTKNSWTKPDKNRVEANVLDVLLELCHHGCNHLVVTGGEPTLQQNTLSELFEKYSRTSFRLPKVTLETNGAVEIGSRLLQYIHLVSFSPKLHEIKEMEHRSLVLDNLYRASAGGQARERVQIKIVVTSAADLDRAIEFFNHAVSLGHAARESCFIHPEWSVHGAKFPKDLFTEIIRSNYRFGTQQHKTWKLP